MSEQYIFRRVETAADVDQMRQLFDAVFPEEAVGVLAETMFQHLPGTEKKYWLVAEAVESKQIVSAFTLIPWRLDYAGLRLKAAEMGIVGTYEEHRGKGLFSRLNEDFEQMLDEEGFDLAMIQGIPGFYDKFGYVYAIDFENHINLPLHLIPETQAKCSFCLATEKDIPLLLAADAHYRRKYAVTVERDAADWRYLLTESRNTEYSSEFWLVEDEQAGERYYFRIPDQGFGQGLILSEISENMPADLILQVFSFCQQKAIERGKPYLRLNLHNQSAAGKLAVALGAQAGNPYAWQVKIPDPIRFLQAIAPVLEQRLANSGYQGLSGVFRLDFYKSQVDLVWQAGRLAQVRPGQGEADHTFSLNAALLPLLYLGHRTWQEIGQLSPDVFLNQGSGVLLVDVLFPKTDSWIHERY